MQKIDVTAPNYVGFVYKWYIFHNGDWSSYTAISDKDNVVLESSTLKGLQWLIDLRR